MSKYDLSILIPARNEEFMAITCANILSNTSEKCEVIAVIDGYNSHDIPEVHPRLTVVQLPTSIGQRAATNLAARLSKAKYIAKTDGHISVSPNFDTILLEDIQDDWVMVPTMKNLHAFDLVCENGHRRYQGPSGPCLECGLPTKKDILWKAKDSPKSRSYCFDPEPHFQYFGEYTKRKEFKAAGDLTETMSLQGSFFMCTRKKYWELNLSGEEFGSWGSQGIEVAGKFWTTGGKCVVNNRCWYAHMFRTQGGDFSFPYPQQHSKVLETRAKAKDFFFNNKFKKAIYPLSYLLERFWPVQGWEDTDYVNQKVLELTSNRSGICSIQSQSTKETFYFAAENIREVGLQTERLLKEGQYPDQDAQRFWNSYPSRDLLWHVERFCSPSQLQHYLQKVKEEGRVHPTIGGEKVTKGILYYTDGEVDPTIEKKVREQLLKSGLPITSVSLKPIDFGNSLHLPMERGPLAMARQILAGLHAMKETVAYMTEHDVLYNNSHYSHIPTKKDKIAYNVNVWKLNLDKAYALKVDDCRQLSGMCAYRETLIDHYTKRVERIEKTGWSSKIGHEPGTHNRPERIDDLKSEIWKSADPIVDIRGHGTNLTKDRWSKEQFRNQRYTQGWEESRIIPYWGKCEDLIKSLKPKHEQQLTTGIAA